MRQNRFSCPQAIVAASARSWRPGRSGRLPVLGRGPEPRYYGGPAGPDDQAADGLSSDEKYVRALEQLSDNELAGISLSLFGMTLDAVGLIRLRLGEHAMHTWDVAVSLDPAARVAPDAVELLIDNVPQFLAPRLGKPPEVPFRTRIRTNGPERDYLLVAADAISVQDWPGDGGGADSEVRMPSEALLRLAYGRLDPGHTPDEVTADEADLERLRKLFPGF